MAAVELVVGDGAVVARSARLVEEPGQRMCLAKIDRQVVGMLGAVGLVARVPESVGVTIDRVVGRSVTALFAGTGDDLPADRRQAE